LRSPAGMVASFSRADQSFLKAIQSDNTLHVSHMYLDEFTWKAGPRQKLDIFSALA
jgi:hypothetical protein